MSKLCLEIQSSLAVGKNTRISIVNYLWLLLAHSNERSLFMVIQVIGKISATLNQMKANMNHTYISSFFVRAHY